MPYSKSFHLALGSLALVLAPLGCGKSNMAPVTGKVVFPDGTPLATGTVILSPLDKKNNPFGGQGPIGPDGTFRMSTHGGGDGAYLGKYQVSIEMSYHARPDGSGKMVEPKRIMDVGFENPKTSGLEFTVVAGTNDFTINVVKPGQKK